GGRAVGRPPGGLPPPERELERGPDPGRRAHGRVPRRLLLVPSAGPGGGRNVETVRVGWSGFTVTPTTQDETPFLRLADLTEKLEGTTKRLEKRALLAAFLRSLRRDEVAPAIHLIIGRIFAESDSRALKVGWLNLKKALAGSTTMCLSPRPV